VELHDLLEERLPGLGITVLGTDEQIVGNPPTIRWIFLCGPRR
jgi:hypothetical protein